jgi:hypothetical protein
MLPYFAEFFQQGYEKLPNDGQLLLLMQVQVNG